MSRLNCLTRKKGKQVDYGMSWNRWLNTTMEFMSMKEADQPVNMKNVIPLPNLRIITWGLAFSFITLLLIQWVTIITKECTFGDGSWRRMDT